MNNFVIKKDDVTAYTTNKLGFLVSIVFKPGSKKIRIKGKGESELIAIYINGEAHAFFKHYVKTRCQKFTLSERYVAVVNDTAYGLTAGLMLTKKGISTPELEYEKKLPLMYEHSNNT